MLFLDLDRFKVVNDSLGHHAGDTLLQSVALRLDAALRPGDTVARMGGDEFCVLLEDVTDPREATVVAERVLAALADPFPIAGRDLHVSGSIGIALGGPDVDPEELIRDADVAMYRAKAEGKARHAVFDAHMHRHVLARLDLETDLRRAIESRTLQVLYQPIMRTVGCEVTAFEALCRWEVEPRRVRRGRRGDGADHPARALRAARGGEARRRMGHLRQRQRRPRGSSPTRSSRRRSSRCSRRPARGRATCGSR